MSFSCQVSEQKRTTNDLFRTSNLGIRLEKKACWLGLGLGLG